MAVQIQLRRDTAANWTSVNPTLLSGEVGIETDTNKFKIGNGSSNWAALSYATSLATISDWPSTVSATEVGYLDGVTSAIQTQLGNKSDSSHNHTGVYEPSGAVTTHTGLSDPHTQYQLESEKNQANGYAGLDGTGKVAAAQLPSYVDDVLEYANLAAFPGTGATGIIYIALDTNYTYRWSGSVYVQIGGGVGNAIVVKDEGTTKTSAVSSFDFVGTGVTVTNTGNDVTVTVSGGATSGVGLDSVFLLMGA